MRHGCALFMVACLLAASPAAAQTDPSTVFRPKPAPDSDAEWLPATPETMGVTPEVFARLNVGPGGRIPNRPTRRSDGFTQYESPVMLPVPAQGPVALAPGAVVAVAAVRIDSRRWVLKAPIAVGAPFNFTIPAGTAFGGSLDENGEGRPCRTPRPYEAYTPPEDEAGEGYPSQCLVGLKIDGSYAALRLYPHYTDRAKPREMAIVPAWLEPIEPGVTHPNFGPFLAVRRLRIDAVTGEKATVLLEMAFDARVEEQGRIDPYATLTAFRPVRSFDLPLGDGARLSASGMILTVRRAGPGWTVEASGSFDPWAAISPDTTAMRIGEYDFPRHTR